MYHSVRPTSNVTALQLPLNISLSRGVDVEYKNPLGSYMTILLFTKKSAIRTPLVYIYNEQCRDSFLLTSRDAQCTQSHCHHHRLVSNFSGGDWKVYGSL